MKLMVDIKRKEMENLNNNNNNNNNKISKNENISIKFKNSSRPVIQGFLDSLKVSLEEESSSTSTSKSVSRSKILQAVQSHIESSSSSSSSNDNKKLIRTQLIEIAAEYAMLYLGKSSYRKKLIDIGYTGSDYTNDSIILKSIIPDVEPNINDGIMHKFESSRYMNNDIYNDTFTKSNPLKRIISIDDDNLMKIMIIPPEELTSCIPYHKDFDTNDTHSVGRWGESLVYQYLILKENKSRVTWMNIDEEARASYDITVITPIDNNREITTYIEVKSTRYSHNNVFELSLWEWEFATKKPSVNYNIYRVFNAGDPKTVRIVVIKDVLRMITEGSIKLCIAI